MQDSFSHELQYLLANKQITTLLQPIVNIDKKTVFGYEALSRGPSDSTLHPAPMLFETAERCDLMLELESLCLRTAASSWSSYGIPQKLFVNVSPGKLMPSQFNTQRLQNLLTEYDLKACDIVIELSERYPTTDLTALQASLGWLKSGGFLIAIDDLGAGYSGLKLWSELKPDFVKIDRHFIRDIQNDLIKREFLRSVVELADRLNCTLIAEGVETSAELKVVAGLGISLVQGFLFGRPKIVPMANLEALANHSFKAIKPTLLESAGSLCQQITERKIEKARYANPLTLLPGNVPIQKMLDTCTRERFAFTLIYFDINLFKPLNDVLGYRVGDQVILMLTNTLKKQFGEDTDFIGHIADAASLAKKRAKTSPEFCFIERHSTENL